MWNVSLASYKVDLPNVHSTRRVDTDHNGIHAVNPGTLCLATTISHVLIGRVRLGCLLGGYALQFDEVSWVLSYSSKSAVETAGY
jgi:hypothetical protein